MVHEKQKIDRRFLVVSNKKAALHLVLRFVWHTCLIFSIHYCVTNSLWFFSICLFYINAVTWSFMGYAGLAHELFHQRVVSNKKLNLLLYQVCSYLTWSNPYYFSKSHLYHHSNTFSPDDVEVNNALPESFYSLIGLILVDFGLLLRRCIYALANACGLEVFFTPVFNVRKVNQKAKTACREARALLAFNGCFYALLVFSLDAWTAVFVFLSSFTATFLNRFLASTQHEGLSGFADQGPFLHSRTILLPVWLEFFYANMNYHAEHHFKPSVPFYNLPELHSRLRQEGLSNEVGFSSYFLSYIKNNVLKRTST